MLHVREKPPLRQTHIIETPSGKRYRWAEDERLPDNVPSGVRFSDEMPGGYKDAECVLPRKPGTDHADLEPLSTWTVYDTGGEVAWEGRLERAPRTSGDQMAVSPSAVGWQAHLEDDKSAAPLYIDRDLSHWRSPHLTRRRNLLTANFTPTDHSVDPRDPGTAVPGIRLSFAGTWTSPQKPVCEAWYDAGSGANVASVFYTPSYAATVDLANGNYSLRAYVVDPGGTGLITESDVFPSTAGHLWTPAAARRFVVLEWLYDATPAGADGKEFTAWAQNVAVIGDHGLPIRTDGTTGGFFASDIVAHAVRRWAPLLNINDDSIERSSLVISHLAFHDRTTPGEIVRQASRFELPDWAVWEGREFVWHARGARAKRWRARVAPSQLEETGPSVERLWESIIVQYQDVDGSTRTVGPPGSGADTEDAALKDTDPDNPANRCGIVRRDLLQMGTATAASAIEVGRRFLEESKLLNRSGRAKFVGYVEDDHGVLYPYTRPRAGDYVSFVDSNDTSYRRIVKTEKTRQDRTCTVDLDSPPEGLQALLERLAVALVPLGHS